MLANERPPSRLCVLSEWSNFLSLFEAKALHGLLNVKAELL